MGRVRLWLAVSVLAAVHVAAIAADFLAPYDPSAQNRMDALSAPTSVRFVDPEGRWTWRPHVVSGTDRRARGAEPASGLSPVLFFVQGPPRELGPVVVETRLFGVEEPARVFLLGTDENGRDVFSRLLYGARISLFAGSLAAGLCVAVGLVLGMIAGFRGGAADEVLMRLTELFLALPWLYLLFAVRAVLPLDIDSGQAFLVSIVIVSGVGWARPARLFRGVAASAREQDFVLAGRALGATEAHLALRHVLPQCLGVLWTQLALLVPRFILAEVTLSFLGLGVAEPDASWGNMLHSLTKLHVLVSCTWMLAPAVALLIVVLCFEPLADRLQRRARLSEAFGIE